MKERAEEWQELRTLYAEMGEIELLELKAAFADLTDLAQDVLRDELTRRKLWDVELPAGQTTEVGPAGDPRLGGVTVGEYDTVNDANLAAYVLEREGIRAIMGESSGRFDLTLPFVRVAPEDAERATAILAQPISAQTKAEYEETRNLSDFEIPACPHCSSTEVLLEEVEPTNQWLCEECGQRWQDEVAGGGKE